MVRATDQRTAEPRRAYLNPTPRPTTTKDQENRRHSAGEHPRPTQRTPTATRTDASQDRSRKIEADMEGRLSSGHVELALIWLQGRISLFSPWLLFVGRRPASRGQGWGRKAPPRRGLALTAARTTSVCCGYGGNRDWGGPWGDRGRGQRVVSRRVVEADMRGLVTAGPGVRLGA
jgi:hypothetical protein